MLNRIGILGGMGPEATLYFMQLLMKSMAQSFHPAVDQDYPDMTVLMENTTPDRTRAIVEGTAEAGLRVNRAIAGLILAGCDPVVIACISAHALVEQRWFDAGVVDFRRCIINQFESIQTEKMAVFATEGSYRARVFEPLEEHFDLIYPGENHRKKLMSIIYGPRGLKSSESDIAFCTATLNHVVNDFHHQGIDYFLLGCTELETFVSTHGIEGDYIAPMSLMSEEVIDRVRGGVSHK
jgi:aspartate racemase